MSSVIWDQDNLIQKLGDNIEELGHVKHDQTTDTYVLWLRDFRDAFRVNRGYIRGDSYPTMKDAKQHAALSVSARLFHHMWLVALRDSGHEAYPGLAESIADAEASKPLTLSTFREEIDNIKDALQTAQKDANQKYRKARNQAIWFFIAALAATAIAAAASIA